MSKGIAQVFALACELAVKLGATSINHLPGCWEYQVDDQWRIALNGGDEPRKCATGVEVPRFHLYVTFNGFPAGFVTPTEGCIAAGDAANERALIRALKKAIKAAAQQERRKDAG
jgi:hypothetical protein